MASKTDFWSSEAYQTAASFVPQKASVVVEWLDLQPDDRLLDVGCGDGVLDVDFAKTLSRGSGHLHGIDSSANMISTCHALSLPEPVATFSVVDVSCPPLDIFSTPSSSQKFTKIFSNAALHWILAEANAASVFSALRETLVPGGTMVFETGGFGNVREMRTALRGAVARRVGIERASAVDPWFFPDEEFIRAVLEGEGGGWAVEKLEVVERPTMATKEGGVGAWVRLFGHAFLAAIEDEAEREACASEVTALLEGVCALPGGRGHVLGYVRLRCMAKRVG